MFEWILFLPVPPTVNFSSERSETSSIRKGNESSFDRSSHDERKNRSISRLSFNPVAVDRSESSAHDKSQRAETFLSG